MPLVVLRLRRSRSTFQRRAYSALRSSLLTCRSSSSVVTSTWWSTRASRIASSSGKSAYCSGVIRWARRRLGSAHEVIARKRTDHLQWQTLARPAVPAGANAASGEPIGRALRCPALTAFWHEPSLSSTWRRNMDSATVGGYKRSRCSGSTDSAVSSNSGLVSTLKNSTAWVAFARRPMLLRR